jgi:hypothetical protein
MKPTLNKLFGFRLMAFESSATHPKIGGEPLLDLSAIVDKMGDGATVGRISAKIGEEPSNWSLPTGANRLIKTI